MGSDEFLVETEQSFANVQYDVVGIIALAHSRPDVGA